MISRDQGHGQYVERSRIFLRSSYHSVKLNGLVQSPGDVVVRNACDKRWRTGDALNALLDLLPGDLAYDLDLIVWLCDSAEEFPGWLYSALKRAQVKFPSRPGSLCKTIRITTGKSFLG